MAPTRASLLFCFLPPPLRGGSPISSREAGPCRQSEVLQPCLQARGMESLSWLPMFTPSAEVPGGPGPITNQGLRGAPPPRGHRLAPPLQVGVLSDPCSPLGAAVSFFPNGIQCGFVSWVCTTGRVSLGSGSASIMDCLCGRAWAGPFLSLWFSFPTCTGENYRQQRSDEVCMGLRKDMVRGPVWGPALRPEVHFCREQGPQGLCTGCSLCPKSFLPDA